MFAAVKLQFQKNPEFFNLTGKGRNFVEIIRRLERCDFNVILKSAYILHYNLCASNPCLNKGTCFTGYTSKKYLCVLFRCFRIFSTLNTVSLSIKTASGVGSFSFWICFFVFSRLFLCLSLSFHEIVGALLFVCQLDWTQCLQDSFHHAEDYLAQNNLLEYQTYLNIALQGHQKAEGQLVSNLDQQMAWYHLRYTKKRLSFYWKSCAT